MTLSIKCAAIFVAVAVLTGAPVSSAGIPDSPGPGSEHSIDAFTNMVGGKPVAFDDFNRPDGSIDGGTADSGQVYQTNTKYGQVIRNGRYVSDAVGGQAKIAYLVLDKKPNVIGAEFAFKAGADMQENAVIGTARNGFGLGSVQLAVYRNQWRLFVVQNPIVDPYPILLSGAFGKELKVNHSYLMAMYWNEANSSITVLAPDGTRGAVKHPLINQYWGRKLGMQARRPTPSSGNVEFLKLGAR